MKAMKLSKLKTGGNLTIRLKTMTTRTYSNSTDETLVAFHTGRGGRFHNAGYTQYIDQDVSIEAYTDDLFIRFKNSNDVVGRFQNEQIRNAVIEAIYAEDFKTLAAFGVSEKELGEQEYFQANGSSVGLTVKESATGCGTINIDNEYDTTTVCRLKDVSENEARMILQSNRYVSDDVRQWLLENFEDLNAEFGDEEE